MADTIEAVVGLTPRERLAALLPDELRDRWRAWRQARIDASDAQRITQHEHETERQIARLEGKLRADLRRELLTNRRRLISRMTELELAYWYKTSERRGKINRVRFVQAFATPAALYYRVNTVSLPRGVRTALIEDPEVVQDLALACGAPVQTFRSPERGFWIVVERSTGLATIPTFVEYVDALNRMPVTAGPLDFPIGVGSNNRFYHADLEEMPHLLIAGATGFGKSIMLHNLICSVLQRATPKQVRFVMCDLKGGTELGVYAGLPHLFDQRKHDNLEDPEEGAFVIEPRIYSRREEIRDVLQRLYYIVEQRLQLFQKHRLRNLSSWNFHHRGQRYLPRVVCVIDEIANVMLDRRERPEVERLLADIAARGRAPGVHLVIATQRPSVDVITGLIKANFPARIALNTSSQADSRVILDHSGAHNLGTPGRNVYQNESKRWLSQAPFLSESLVDDIIERVMTGKGSIVEMSHSVGRGELVAWAIEENSGAFGIDEVYGKFRDRGVTHQDVRIIAAELSGKVLEHNGHYYRLMPGRGPNPRRFVEVDDAD